MKNVNVRARGLALALGLGLVSSVLVPTAANAAFSDSCWGYSVQPTSDGNYIYSESTAVCDLPRTVTGTGTKAQRYNFGWADMASYTYAWGSGAYSRTAYSSTYCNGLGVFDARAAGTGVNNISEQGYWTGGSTSVAC